MPAEKKDVRISFVLSMTGAMIAYYIGASTASGQEFFQAYATHGLMGIIGVIIQQVLIAALAFMVILTCKKHNISNAKDCFIWFMGKYVGTVVYYYTVAFIFCTLIQLISGTGNIVKQYYHVPYYVGACTIAFLSIISVLFGFNRLISIISKIAPFIVVIMAITAAISLINPTDGLIEGSAMVLASENIYRTSTTWYGSTILHHTYLILFFIPYFVSCHISDMNATRRETIMWICLAYFILAVVCVLMILSQVANMSIAIGAQAPNVIIAATHTPWLATIFVIIIMAAVYTTTSPIALIAAEYFAKPGTNKYKIVGTVIVLLAFAISFAGSYAQIINILVSVSGRIGLAVYIFSAIYICYRAITSKKAVASEDSDLQNN